MSEFTLKTDIAIAQKLMVKDFEINDPGLVFSKMELLQEWLAGEIGVLLDKDIERLLNVLYRIDVSEAKIKIAFSGDNPTWEIAGLIIERELEKVETRKKYR